MLAPGNCSGWRATLATGCRPRQFWQRPAHSAATEPGTSAAPASSASVSSASVAASSCATVASSALPIRFKVLEHLQQAHWVGSSLTVDGRARSATERARKNSTGPSELLYCSKLTLAPAAGNPKALCPCCIGCQSPADGTRVSFVKTTGGVFARSARTRCSTSRSASCLAAMATQKPVTVCAPELTVWCCEIAWATSCFPACHHTNRNVAGRCRASVLS